MVNVRFLCTAAWLSAATLLVACSSSGNGMNSAAPPMQNVPPNTISSQSVPATSVLKMLNTELTIGSTTPQTPGDVNPYGLDIARVTSGPIHAGDLVVCDFNDPGNVQGTGTQIIRLHPVVGAVPLLIAKDPTLQGCNAIAMSSNGTIWAAAFKANDNPIFTSSGTLLTSLPNGPWSNPFGETFAPPNVFYVSNAGNGTLVRVTVNAGPTFHFTVIASGFPINGGKPGSILSPSGLNYQASTGRLYVVDGTFNTLYAIDHVSAVGANGITVTGAQGLSFSGPARSDAHVIFHGAPLNGPISSAILPGGNIAVGNTLDPDGKNLMVEISPTGALLDVKNVDQGAAGAIFGMVATGDSPDDAKLYFNDDNDNTVKVLKH
jgi:hypothetical protein